VLTVLTSASLDLDNYQPFHATRADLLRRLDRNSEAAAAYERAAAMAPTDAERDFLRLGGERRAERPLTSSTWPTQACTSSRKRSIGPR